MATETEELETTTTTAITTTTSKDIKPQELKIESILTEALD